MRWEPFVSSTSLVPHRNQPRLEPMVMKMDEEREVVSVRPEGHLIPLRDAIRYWAKLGFINFGGPAGQIAIMHDELVDKRRWVSESSFLHGLNFCMLLPGPEAMQLATWLGWRLHGVRGGLAAGALFVLPAMLLMALLGWIYVRFGQVPLVAGALFGVQAAVLGIIVHALLRIGGRVLETPFALLLAILAGLALEIGRAHV